MIMPNTSDILFDTIQGDAGQIGIITLNRPQALNALNHTMITKLYQSLECWKADPHIQAVIIRASEGRAFCAGGDLRAVYEGHRTPQPLAAFFQDEYALNRLIFHYPKPYIALLDGITIGGGAGISIHGTYRIATKRLTFAMPETGIGFFTDVGGTYFLSHLPQHIGFYLGLTGARLNSDDCVELGLAQCQIAASSIPFLIQQIAAHDFTQPLDQLLQTMTLP